ncbi:TonB-dependent receptor [Vibrio vulnificus]|uniref:TonB-dependent receptor plug domain-containing protein n=1 Tax=Vibrio vulnificus TaxID=672 RepID=UPI001028FF8D|nr:TonB-dependent receptor [Vibrio vulnificus]EGR0751804.1 TonB-dependent receptor [Vibrio vulnificus]RZP93343.1 TonB-dependent receptor [Vibrio vulnificus]
MRSIPFYSVLLPSILILPSSVASEDLLSLLDMPLSSLAETKVVSATKTSQSLADTPASVYVITAKEINRSGARSVADVLALAPGLHVAKFSNYDWGITARGSNQPLSNTLLVMVDGRSVFNPMFSGVDWDLIPVSLANIAQIEIVLGPVGTIWGGNAVTGVVNIITKDPEEADKATVTAQVGNFDYQEYQMRHAAPLGEYAYVSGYLEFVEHKPWTSEEARVQPHQDYAVYTERFGARLDYQYLANTVSAQVGGIRSKEDYQWGTLNPYFLFPDKADIEFYDTKMTMEEYFAGVQHIYDHHSGNRWHNEAWLTYSANDSTDRNARFTRLDLDSHIVVQDWFGSQLTIGGNVRLIDEEFGTYSPQEHFSMPYLRIAQQADFFSQSYGVYVNWDLEVTEKTDLILGSRWQYNNLTKEIDAQPQVRASYELADNQRIWAGWGKAIVTPSRLELTTALQSNNYIEGALFSDGNRYDYFYSFIYQGSEDLRVENVETYELGYRIWSDEVWQFSAGTYYSKHHNIRAYAGVSSSQIVLPGNSSPGTVGTVIEQYVSQMVDPLWSETVGGELAFKWAPIDAVQLNMNYSYKRIIGHCEGAICGSNQAVKRELENQPNHFVNAQLMWDITPQWWASSTLQYISESQMHSDYTSDERYQWPEVFSVDIALSWQHSKAYPRLTAVVENLGADQSTEFPQAFSPYQNEVQYWLTLAWSPSMEQGSAL